MTQGLHANVKRWRKLVFVTKTNFVTKTRRYLTLRKNLRRKRQSVTKTVWDIWRQILNTLHWLVDLRQLLSFRRQSTTSIYDGETLYNGNRLMSQIHLRRKLLSIVFVTVIDLSFRRRFCVCVKSLIMMIMIKIMIKSSSFHFISRNTAESSKSSYDGTTRYTTGKFI